MTTDILEISDFVVLIDSTDAKEAELFQCQFEEDTVGISFYDSGHVNIEVSYENESQVLKSRKGNCFSYFANQGVKFSHEISQSEPLRSVSIFSTLKNLKKLPETEKALFNQFLGNVLTSAKSFETGPQILMTPEMRTAVSKIFDSSFESTTRMLFLKSQVLELMSHYFGQIELIDQSEIDRKEIKKIYRAEELLILNMNKPPSLNELSRLVGTNSNKLKTNFKQIFGVPVFKYLQTQRLQKAYQLLQDQDLSAQEVAWFVGYESLSSFSNAFYKHYGVRPSQVSK